MLGASHCTVRDSFSSAIHWKRLIFTVKGSCENRGNTNKVPDKEVCSSMALSRECIGRSLRFVAGGEEVLTRVNLHILPLNQQVFMES